VKPYIRRQKNDASDAAAICEAVTRPSIRFVGVRSLENLAALMRHKTREMLVSQRTQLFNGLRGHLTEVGVIAAHPRAGGQISRIIPVRPIWSTSGSTLSRPWSPRNGKIPPFSDFRQLERRQRLRRPSTKMSARRSAVFRQSGVS
jgi:hypothetical protein